MGIEEDIKYLRKRFDIMEHNIDNIEMKLNKLIIQKAPKDRSDKADKIDKALSDKVKNGKD